MSPGARLTVAGLALAGAIVLLGVTVVPTHVTFGAGSLRCGTVLYPDRSSEVSRFCGATGANQLHAVLIVGAVLGALALGPVALGRKRAGDLSPVLAVFAVLFLCLAALAVAWLATVEYSPPVPVFPL
jgi:hypothetical protein